MSAGPCETGTTGRWDQAFPALRHKKDSAASHAGHSGISPLAWISALTVHAAGVSADSIDLM